MDRVPINTARTILSLWAAGTTQRNLDVKFPCCHGDRIMPLLLGRIVRFSDCKAVGRAKVDEMFPAGIYAEFSKPYFDCAQAYAPEAFDLLRKIVPLSHPRFPPITATFLMRHCEEQFGELKLSASAQEMILGRDASALLPHGRP